MDSKIYKYTLLWKYLETCLSWKLTLRFLYPRVSYIVLCTLSIFIFIFSSFYFSLCADQTGSTPLFFPLAVCDPNLVAWGTGKHLACENISAVDGWGKKKKRKTKGHAIPSLLTQATGSLHPGRKKHVVAGNTLEQFLLIYSLSNKGPTILQGLEGQDGLADVRSTFGPRGNSFIHSCIHSLIHLFVKFKFRSLVPMWASYHVHKWPKLKMAWVVTEWILSVPKQLKPQWSRVKCSVFHTCTVCNFPNAAPSSCFQKHLHSFSLGNMLQCLIISIMKLFCRIENLLAFYCKNSNFFVNDNKTFKNAEIVILKFVVFLELLRGFIAFIWDYSPITSCLPREIYPNIMYGVFILCRIELFYLRGLI